MTIMKLNDKGNDVVGKKIELNCDCIAISLLELRGFKSTQFKSLHPGGNLGKDLKNLNDVMHLGKKLPLAKLDEKMSKSLITMTRKSFGCIGVINNNHVFPAK